MKTLALVILTLLATSGQILADEVCEEDAANKLPAGTPLVLKTDVKIEATFRQSDLLPTPKVSGVECEFFAETIDAHHPRHFSASAKNPRTLAITYAKTNDPVYRPFCDDTVAAFAVDGDPKEFIALICRNSAMFDAAINAYNTQRDLERDKWCSPSSPDANQEKCSTGDFSYRSKTLTTHRLYAALNGLIEIRQPLVSANQCHKTIEGLNSKSTALDQALARLLEGGNGSSFNPRSLERNGIGRPDDMPAGLLDEPVIPARSHSAGA